MAKNTGNLNAGTDSLALARQDLYDMAKDIGYEETGDVSPISTTGGNNKIVKTDASGNAVLTGGMTAGALSTIDASPTGLGEARYELAIFEDATIAGGRGGGIAFGLDTTVLAGIKAYTPYSSVTQAELRFQVRKSNVLVDGMILDEDGSLALTGGLTAGGGYISLQEITTPSATANYGKIYTKTDNKLYVQTGDGVEHQIAFV